MTDTIFALSSGVVPAAIAIVRVSGPVAFEAAEALVGPLPPPRRAGLRALREPSSGELLDRGLVLAFPADGSVTGDDLVEFHLHGGRAVVRAVESALAVIDGVRPALAGEFTRRSLASGRLDLTAAEGLADLLSAETEAQRRAALRSADGLIRRQIEQWSAATVAAAAQVEAAIDHEEEGDVGAGDTLARGVADQIATLVRDIEVVLSRPSSERLHDGLRVVLAGPPNSGKSTLINALAERDVAIVSPIAGTTRDRIDAPVVRDGRAWLFTDTAGLTESDDQIEAIGVARARESIAAADLVLWLGDGPPPSSEMIAVHARADLPHRRHVPEGRIPASGTSVKGTAALWEALGRAASTLVPAADELALNNRQRALANAAASALRHADGQSDLLIAAEQLRIARELFDRITARASVEHVLDALFARFCIGK
ncbi:tRNA modification GTPase [Sphingomonas guangdongensis]|uniref:tRNA modification GTPase MnmE n=1 Tax=Sphingomonas guangdongensis TaxID=1141890 RepID=A0A285QEX7_9SPHN|nr:tRNA uridine-5-carboxymethylaminomethyl(34) synthesis GTPase MnmE [Sphingomonas guangdongensis]SOB80433.1 tRNA modification GTPase [Sphingomonas guangdongensis]